jgi:hypothetical protein
MKGEMVDQRLNWLYVMVVAGVSHMDNCHVGWEEGQEINTQHTSSSSRKRPSKSCLNIFMNQLEPNPIFLLQSSLSASAQTGNSVYIFNMLDFQVYHSNYFNIPSPSLFIWTAENVSDLTRPTSHINPNQWGTIL